MNKVLIASIVNLLEKLKRGRRQDYSIQSIELSGFVFVQAVQKRGAQNSSAWDSDSHESLNIHTKGRNPELWSGSRLIMILIRCQAEAIRRRGVEADGHNYLGSNLRAKWKKAPLRDQLDTETAKGSTFNLG